MLMQNRQEKRAWEKECAALAGYCAGLATGLARNGKLGGFDTFYEKPKPNAEPPPSTEDHIRMMRERGEGGPPT